MLTVFVSDAVVTANILNTTFIRALTSLARANTAVYDKIGEISFKFPSIFLVLQSNSKPDFPASCWSADAAWLKLFYPCDKFEPLFLSESSLSGQNMSLRGWPLVANLSNVRPVSVQVLKKQKMPVWDWVKMQ